VPFSGLVDDDRVRGARKGVAVQWLLSRSLHDRAIDDGVSAAMTWAVDRSIADLGDYASLVGTYRREGLEHAFLRLGDHDLLVRQNDSAADRNR
jgi:hypothetical protein